MFGDSYVAVGLAWAVFGVLCVLAWLRIRTIWPGRSNDPAAARPSSGVPWWHPARLLQARNPHAGDVRRSSNVAAVFGVAASLSLGVIVPLDIVDAVVGGNNNWNLATSCLTVCAFWFFRDAAHGFVLPSAPRYRKRLLVLLLLCIAIPFFLIQDHGPTSAQFMQEHVDQIANVIYNITYMCVLGWVVGDLVMALRHQWNSRYWTYVIGLAVVWLSCVDEIVYIVSAHLIGGPIADFTYDAFYVLCFGGILIVAVGWIWIVASERDYIGAVRWRVRSGWLLAVLVAVRNRKASVVPTGPGATISTHRPAARVGTPRLLVPAYIPPASSGRTLSVLPTASALELLRILAGPSSEDVAYRLVVQIRNTAARQGTSLTAREEQRLVRVEQRFPGY